MDIIIVFYPERKMRMERNKNFSKPYMGDLTSQQIGNMAKSGQLGGEMVKRMIKYEENELMNSYNEKKNE